MASDLPSLLTQNMPLLSAAGGFFAGACKDVFADATALAGGNHVKVWKTMQFERLLERAKALHNERKVEAQPLSPSIGAPLLEAAALEAREEIIELWVRLLAAATDPAKANNVRLQYVEDLKRFAPLDALVLQNFVGMTLDLNSSMRADLARQLGHRQDEIEVSFHALAELGYAVPSADSGPTSTLRIFPTAKSREILRVLGFIAA